MKTPVEREELSRTIIVMEKGKSTLCEIRTHGLQTRLRQPWLLVAMLGKPVSGGVCAVCPTAGVFLTSKWFLANSRHVPSFHHEARMNDQN